MNSQKIKVTIIFSISLLVLIGIVQFKNKEKHWVRNNLFTSNYTFDKQSVFIVNGSVKNIHSNKECDSLLFRFINLNNTYKRVIFDKKGTVKVETPFYNVSFSHSVRNNVLCMDTISIHTTKKHYCEN